MMRLWHKNLTRRRSCRSRYALLLYTLDRHSSRARGKKGEGGWAEAEGQGGGAVQAMRNPRSGDQFGVVPIQQGDDNGAIAGVWIHATADVQDLRRQGGAHLFATTFNLHYLICFVRGRGTESGAEKDPTLPGFTERIAL